MDKFSELKRLAEKCPVQRFEPFIGRAGGRGTQAIFNADTKGEVITWSGFDSSDVTSRTGREAIARFVAAVDPETVLALLAELDSWKRLAELRGENWEKDISNLLEARERIAELEQKERHSERQNVIDGLAGAGESWADIEEYMVKWDEARRNG